MKKHLVSKKFLSFSSRIKQPLPRLVIKVLLGSNTRTQSQQNYDSVKATKQKEKDKSIGLPPNKRYCLTPLARHKSDRTTSKSNVLPMHRHFIGKQIGKTTNSYQMQGRRNRQ